MSESAAPRADQSSQRRSAIASETHSGASVQSDALAAIRELVTHLPALAPILGYVPRVRVVVDANVVLDELGYLVASRRNATARTALQELAASGTIVLYAPPTINNEVERHLEKIASRRGVDVERLQVAWAAYRTALHIFEPDPLPPGIHGEVVDPDDLPYVSLQAQLGARAVFTNDRHLGRMGADVVQFEAFLSLREYARAASVELTIKLGACVAAAATLGLSLTLIKLVSALVRASSRLPREVQAAVAISVAALLLHPKGRAATIEKFRAFSRLLEPIGATVGPVALRASDQLTAAQRAAAKSLQEAERQLPTPRKSTVRARARALCAASAEPLSIDAIEARMRSDGYASSAKSARAYLLRVLRQDARLSEIAPGRWVAVRSATTQTLRGPTRIRRGA
jgi:predicted nucleic acid-binding protein